jgi:hypothetical protein
MLGIYDGLLKQVDHFSEGLNLEQVDTLWRCVALDEECSDDCLNWFLNQAKSKDHHALCLETFKHIFLGKVWKLNISLLLIACRIISLTIFFI